MATDNWNKFRALVWKTIIIEFYDLRIWIIRNLVPLVAIIGLVVVRIYYPVTDEDAVIYEEALPIDNLNLLKDSLAKLKISNSVNLHLAYSPNTSPVFENIVKEAAASLDIPYSSYANSKALEDALIDENYLAGIEFDMSMADVTTYPDQLNYKLRFPSELRTSHNEGPEITMWMTDQHFMDFEPNGPRNKDDIDGGIPPGYLREGFLPVQNAISTAFIIQAASNKESLPKIFLQRYPYPPYIFDAFVVFGSYFGVLFAYIFLYPIFTRVMIIMQEKEKQIREILKIMGVQDWLRWVACFVNAMIPMSFFAVLIVIATTVKWENDAGVFNHSSVTLILFFFVVFVIADLTLFMLLTTFFSSPYVAIIVTQLVNYVTLAPYLVLLLSYDGISVFIKLVSSLFPITAMCLGVRALFIKEAQGDGITWSNVFSPLSVDDALSMGLIIIMMLLSSVIFMTLCLYFDKIFPGEYGVAQKWNFPFKKSFWIGNRENADIEIVRVSNNIKRNNPDAFDEEPKNAKVGLHIRNLTKVFGDKTAVNNVSMNLYEGETTVLLGHNGAGKTTVVSMVTGMIPPTSGTAIINGYDIKKNLQGARMSLGLCPQHNILFDELTVRQHLVFYSRIKGLDGDELESEVKKYLRKTDLENKADTMSSKLSGGMKRKLSVCAAFCGGTKVVLCDEPSSGMDPAARRQLWDLIISVKHERTILLTTHFMDEADALGDRIAIMSVGELKCFGTPFFLKKKFGSGYHLTCVKEEDCDSAKVTSLLSKYIPGIEPVSEIGTELSYRLPDAYSRIFKAMFEDLESQSKRLKIEGYGISIASLEDVFMKVGAESAAVERSVPRPRLSTSESEPESDSSLNSENMFSSRQRLLKGNNLIRNQWRSMMLKKYLYAIRNKILFFAQNFVPIFFIAVTMIMNASSSFKPLHPLSLDLLEFPETVTVLETDPSVKDESIEAQISNNYKRVVNSLGPGHELAETGDANFIEYIMALGKTIQSSINLKYIAAATVNEGRITAWLNNKALHSAPMSLNLIHNAMARTVIGPRAGIHVTNDPLPYSRDTILKMLDNTASTGFSIRMNLGFAMCVVTSMYVIFLINERECRAKIVQFVSGVRAVIFWLGHFIWDFCTLMITSLVMMLAIACCQVDGFSTFDELVRYMVILIAFGCAALPFSYILSYFGSSGPAGFQIALMTSMFSMMIFMFWTSDSWMRQSLMIVPVCTLVDAMNNLYDNGQIKKACHRVIETLTEAERCENIPICCKSTPYFAWNSPGMLKDLSIFFLSCVLFFSFLIYKDLHMLNNCLPSWGTTSKESDYFDEDVEHEKELVAKMSSSEIAEENLVLDRLTKYYRKFLAVNRLSLVVKHSECFGLLGVNGAGKTTTFKMLTGDETISSGEAYVKGLSVKKDINQVYHDIGYCPQFDALFDDFTGREMLKIYCLLRGIPEDRIDQLSTTLAREFGFMKHYNKPVGTYSGGNKRKLSAAITMIGSPSLIYLDEPTSGMDPGARRQLWNMICRIRDAGKSIVLTSHNMDECEALCTRLAIMVNGEFKCIGSVQHLKNRFTKGLVLKIKMKKYGSQERRLSTRRISTIRRTVQQKKQKEASLAVQIEEDTDVVIEFIEGEFPGAYLKERFQEILTFYIPLHGILWSKIFGVMESNKEDLNIEDYTICQTSLEEIFLQFAQQQRVE